jgi:hypothetical protein
MLGFGFGFDTSSFEHDLEIREIVECVLVVADRNAYGMESADNALDAEPINGRQAGDFIRHVYFLMK